MNSLQDLDTSTERHFEKQVCDLFDLQKVLIDASNDSHINFFNDQPGAVDSPYFNTNELNSLSQKLCKYSFPILCINFRSFKSYVNIYL